jgi:hypothetical protein
MDRSWSVQPRTDGRPGLAQTGGDPVQASEVVKAEIASRVLDQSLTPHLGQFGTDDGARRADKLR